MEQNLNPFQCPACFNLAECKIAGPNSKNPNRVYYVCPFCVNEKGQPKFLKFAPFAQAPPPAPAQPTPQEPSLKRPRLEIVPNFKSAPAPVPLPPSPIPAWASQLNLKIDLAISKLDTLLQCVESPQSSEKDEASTYIA